MDDVGDAGHGAADDVAVRRWLAGDDFEAIVGVERAIVAEGANGDIGEVIVIGLSGLRTRRMKLEPTLPVAPVTRMRFTESLSAVEIFAMIVSVCLCEGKHDATDDERGLARM